MAELFQVILALVLVVICGLFVAGEFSMLAVNRGTVERLAAKGDIRANGVLKVLKSLSTQLSSAQIAITLTNLAIGFLAEPGIARLIRPVLSTVGLTESHTIAASLILGLVISTFITMIWGELVPKNIAIARPLATAKFVQAPLLFFSLLAKGGIIVLNSSANFILRRFGIEPQEELASARSADELLSLVRRSAEKGTLEKDTALMLERSLNFGDLTSLDVMTPRVRIKAVHQDEMLDQVLAAARQSGFSKFPVYGDNLDDIVGVIHIKQVFRVAADLRASRTVRDHMRPPALVPTTIELEPLLKILRSHGMQMGIVIDEYGGCSGIVTLEDLLEELVGDVEDEHDRSRLPVRRQQDDRWLLSGLLRPDEIAERTEIYLPEENGVDTLGGLLLLRLGRIPSVGDMIHTDAVDRSGNELQAELTVKRMDGNRIDRVLMKAEPSRYEDVDT